MSVKTLLLVLLLLNGFQHRATAQHANAKNEVPEGARTPVVVSVQCESMCTYFANLAHEKFCITESETFRFRMRKEDDYAFGDMLPELAQNEITGSVEKQDVFPRQGVLEMSLMSMLDFWPRC